MNKKLFIFCFSGLLFLNFGIGNLFAIANCPQTIIEDFQPLYILKVIGSVKAVDQENFLNLKKRDGSSITIRNVKIDNIAWSYEITKTKILIFLYKKGETVTTSIDFNPKEIYSIITRCKEEGKLFVSKRQVASDPSNGIGSSVYIIWEITNKGMEVKISYTVQIYSETSFVQLLASEE